MKLKLMLPAALLGLLVASRAQTGDGGRIAVVGPTTRAFGEYPEGESRTARFTVRNTGKDELRITRVRQGCGCAKAKIGNTALSPGEQTDIEIRVLPYSISGAYRKTAYVESSDPHSPVIRLTYGGTARPLVRVEPRQFVYAGRQALDATHTQSFTLTPTEPGVVFGAPAVTSTVTVATVIMHETGKSRSPRSLVFSYSATNAGPFRIVVDVPITTPTNHPPIKLGITGHLGGQLVASPSRLHVAATQPGTEHRVALRFLGDDASAFNTDRVEPPHQAGVACRMLPTTAAGRCEAVLVFDDAFLAEVRQEGPRDLVFRLPRAAPAHVRVAK